MDRYNYAVERPRNYEYPYRPSDANNGYDDYYCKPSVYDPSAFDCVHESVFHNAYGGGGY